MTDKATSPSGQSASSGAAGGPPNADQADGVGAVARVPATSMVSIEAFNRVVKQNIRLRKKLHKKALALADAHKELRSIETLSRLAIRIMDHLSTQMK